MRPSTLLLIGLLLTSSARAQAALWPSSVLRVERDLQSQDVEVRRRAAQLLRDLPASSAARLAGRALDDSDLDVRLAALDASLGASLPGLGDRLVPWLTDGERRLRLAAAEALTESPSPRAVSSLGRALGDADPGVRSAAAQALGRSGAPEAALALLGHLDDSVPEVRRDVALALGELGDLRAVVPLIGKIQDARPIVREGVAEALARLADPRSVSALVLSLHDADDGVRIAALGALSRIADPSTVASIGAVLPGSVDDVHSAALDALSHIRSPGATKTLIDELRSDRSGGARSEAVAALGRSGSFASPALTACLSAESDADRLGDCALALGRTHDVAGALAIQGALRRGTLPALPALVALSELRAPESLPAVLEYLADPDVLVRRAARMATRVLLDPRRPDGRAVEPISHALSSVSGDPAELSELLELLGQTGSPRAALILLPYASAGDNVVARTRALSALGFLGEAGQGPTLLNALDDKGSGSVRLAAALALGRLRLPGRALPLLDRLQHGNEAERLLLTLALAQTIATERDPKVEARLERLLRDSQGGERDALIELFGRMPTALASQRLSHLTTGLMRTADRAKFAESLAAQPAERGRLAPLLRDPNALVRANAAWSLGEVGLAADNAALQVALADSDVKVAGNALQALALIAVRTHGRIAAQACAHATGARPLLRALAYRALRVTGERCPRGEEITALSRDRHEFVRQSAATLLRDVPESAEDERALQRARDRDPSGAVAAECAAPRQALVTSPEPTVVLVIPAGEDAPRPGQPFALLRADGLVRLGVSDRRGQLFEVAAPHGPLSLLGLSSELE